MDSSTSRNVRCLFLGEYVDQASDSPGAVAPGTEAVSEAIKTRVLGQFVDRGVAATDRDESMQDFLVLLKQPERSITVRGSGLHYIPAPRPGESGSYAVVACRGGRERI